MSEVVVLGAGLGGVPMALELKASLREADRITIIGDSPAFSFVPSNPWVAVGWREPQAVSVPLEPVFQRRGIRFLAAGAARVVPDRRTVLLRDGTTISYDYLVIATGPELAFDEIEGFGPDRNTVSVCTLSHAMATRERWNAFCADPGPVLVGAVQGASCFGPAYEFAFIMDSDLCRRRLRDRVPMTFVTSEPYIGHLGLGGVGDTKGMLESLLRDRHIRWITNARIESVGADHAIVAEMDEDGKERRRHDIPFKMAMLLPAFRGVGALKAEDGTYIPGLTNPRGFVVVDSFQRNPTFPDIFAVGVCVAIAPLEKTPVPTGVPKTGFMIESMVTATAHNIRALLDGRQPSVAPTWNAICLADFGNRGAAFVAVPQIPPRNLSWSSEGRWVHYAKVAFEKYFMHKIRQGVSEPIYEKYVLKLLGIGKLR
ncbi:MAG: FAD-dependent oxidoreductase [Magnetospirillum sp.]|nr:FAD-dependent oxidoreductase [Magnetospirillum sp.]